MRPSNFVKATPTLEERAFLTAVRAKPDARAVRLVYADWLDERNDPRGELIRIEEEMRVVPIYSDAYWERKPRRRELLATVEAPWLKHMGYGGTDYEPVFADVPDGWKERWRLIREFVERWYQIPMDDVGGPLKPVPPEFDGNRGTLLREVDEGFNDLIGRELVPSALREWVFCFRDVVRSWPDFDDHTGNDPRFCSDRDGLLFMSLAGGREILYVRPEDRKQADPPVWWDTMYRYPERDSPKQLAPRMTTLALEYLLTLFRPRMDTGEGEIHEDKMTKKFARRLEQCFPVRSLFDELQVFEQPNAVAFWCPKSVFVRDGPCFRLIARPREKWEEVFDQLFAVDR